ncbi:MAG: hypothetical protein AAB953_03450, partial [Patescibacteria group bacterium]
LFLERKKKYSKCLEKLMEPHSGYIGVYQTDFTGYLAKVAEMARSHTVFLYVDPYGITELLFDELGKIYEQIDKSGGSVEVLINFNSPGFVRCGLVALKMESTLAVDSELTGEFDDESFIDIQGLTPQQMDEIAGGDYWRDIVVDLNLSFSEKEQRIGELYAHQMNRYYPITVDYPIKAKYHHRIPKYRLIYGTRHPDGIFLMNDIMYDARERFLKSEFADGKLFDTRPIEEQKDMMVFTKKIYEIVSEKEPIARKLVKLIAMQDFFFRYKTGDYSKAVTSLLKEYEGLRLYSKSGKTRINDDELLATKPFK